jgi:hypothetical protein
MKSFLLIFTFLLVSHSTLAEPRDGDEVVFRGSRSEGELQIERLEIYSISDFNQTSGECMFRSRIFENGKLLLDKSQPVKISDIFSEEKAQAFVDQCTENNGVREQIEVPAGIFDTCRVTMASSGGGEGVFNIAAVPFGSVKSIEGPSEDKKFTLVLTDIIRGRAPGILLPKKEYK